MTIIN